MEAKSETITFTIKGDQPFDVVHYLPPGDAGHKQIHEDKLSELKKFMGEVGIGEAMFRTELEEINAEEKIKDHMKEYMRTRAHVGVRR